jgi:DMSO/TMAO reductase YedYZ molybdopterin-dependent catalytic subunit
LFPSQRNFAITPRRSAKPGLSRRQLLRSVGIAGGALCVGLDHFLSGLLAAAPQFASGGDLLALVPFTSEGRVPLEQIIGDELDGRLYTDLSKLGPGHVATSAANFYVRTRASSLLKDGDLRSIQLQGISGDPVALAFGELRARARPLGLHLMECAGNTRDAHFGLMSVANWTGVPLIDLLQRLPASPVSRVLVSGFDRYAAPSTTSIPGASWIFSLDQIHSSGAFLAVAMDGNPLARDHGAPVRLVVPGWYGCACIKWVDEIRQVAQDAEATSQMREYAFRTHQQGVPQLAKEFQAAIIDQAAMPVRVEKWRVDRKLQYRVLGILWGGTAPVKRLEIRFNPEENYVPVEHVHQTANDPWSFWQHTWHPKSPGTYLIRLRVADPGVRTRRLDMGFYVREVDIDEV